MKFIKLFLTSLITSVVFGVTEENQNLVDQCINEFIKGSKHCNHDMRSANESNYTSLCQSFVDDYCYLLFTSQFKNQVKYVPSCEEAFKNDKLKNEIYAKLGYKASIARLVCSKDNDGSMCDVTQAYLKGIKDENKIKKIIDSNCNSTRCTSIYLEYLDATLNSYNDETDKATKELAKKLKDYVLSNECQSKMKKGTERCGPGFGYCLEGCCSKYGFCGDSLDHCLLDCDLKYSMYCMGSADNVSTVPGRCGKEFGGCPKAGDCCSKYGYCGTTDDHCGDGCQRGYGECNRLTKISGDKLRCGENRGKCVNPEDCCSEFGYCGVTEAHCGVGCQSEFGVCKETNIKPSKITGRCGPEYGTCANSSQCCSKYGYCGTSKDHCGVGCQEKYGYCSPSAKTTTTTTTTATTTTTSVVKTSAATTNAAKTSVSNTASDNASVIVTGNTINTFASNEVEEIPVSNASGRCGPEFGKCPKSTHCCSKYNYCGTSIDHCNDGCQPKYGICN